MRGAFSPSCVERIGKGRDDPYSQRLDDAMALETRRRYVIQEAEHSSYGVFATDTDTTTQRTGSDNYGEHG